MLTKKVVLMLVAVVLIAAFAPVGCASTTTEREWVIQSSEASLQDYSTNAWNDFGDRVAARTDNKMTFRTALAGEMGVDRDEFSYALSEGQLQVSYIMASVEAGSISYLNVFHLPYLGATSDDWYAIADALEGKIAADFKALGYEPLGHWLWPPQDILSNKPLDIANLAETKVRIWRDLDAQLITSLGGEPLYMPITEVYLAMQRGVVDAMNTGPQAMADNSMYEVGTYYYAVELPPSITWLCVNSEEFAKLPSEWQDIMREEALTTQEYIRYEALPGLTDEKRGVLEANGVEINFLSDDEIAAWRAAAEDIWATWAAADPEHQEVLDIARKAIGL